MQNHYLPKLIVIGLILWGFTIWTDSFAQDAEYILAHQDIFGTLRRPHVTFSHENHVEILESESCGICHHVLDGQSGRLIYAEGEEDSCKECHLKQKEDHKPALREAYHGSCTVCHRRLIKANIIKSGPTTCGVCHIKR